ncbi:heavy metal-responsive transcriptional regulator [Legionella pneumophila serogroup 1]|uniref:Mercuric resistance operon regulatory protein n=1 Tax=Fluoribacter dumoffii TaxID=463 RepID=A0A377GBU6_9GAMM|nr:MULTISPECIES: heavy metal-responsive transcriptional regulator [Legionellaceae]KTC92817.1 transcriptional regulator, MerR family [Fluoribacter dumoffii NY 23]MDW8868279.1 heavy metal-responsive transcriptional regulator [Legionella pneumophila]MDW9174858.1 heavy metal-responsive transcriptional regulator [Legionella pneumophila]SNV18464.1 transcriptional regulator, MerR family [Legionella pneumophila]STO22109.1 Mercuric resistance operon regulatory protein [Fluoribacter dumoffii]
MALALTIGQVASLAGVSHDTIRLYERYGLIEEPPRAANGYRQYPVEAVDKLRFIQRAKTMGFALKEIQELLSIHHSSKQSCGEVRSKAQQNLAHIAEKIQELKRLEKALKALVSDCETRQPDELCSIFVSLKQKG